MAENIAAYGPVADSPHVMSATNVQRGDTPAVWDAVGDPNDTGVWKGVDKDSGEMNEHWTVTAPFPTTGRWKQT